jgi:coatomer protein complex subunit epsilon
MADPLYSLRNSFALGAYNTVINDAADLDLGQAEAIERDVLVYRSYIAVGSYDVSGTQTSRACIWQALDARRLSG